MTEPKEFPSDKADKFVVRFPDGMRDRIKEAAEENNRSMNAEIVARLENSLSEAPLVDDAVMKMFVSVALVQSREFFDEILEEALGKDKAHVKGRLNDIINRRLPKLEAAKAKADAYEAGDSPLKALPDSATDVTKKPPHELK